MIKEDRVKEYNTVYDWGKNNIPEDERTICGHCMLMRMGVGICVYAIDNNFPFPITDSENEGYLKRYGCEGYRRYVSYENDDDDD